jgi:lysophospholipase L1-like esterase
MEEPAGKPEPTNAPTASIQPPATLTIVPTIVGRGNPVFISAEDERIRYGGRFDFSDPQHVYFDWSGIMIEAAFSGPLLQILLKDGTNLYNVTIDGRSKILKTNPEKTSYLVAQDLPDGPHVVRLTKRTEAFVGAGVFSGFILEAGHDLLEKPASAGRLIEFIGDSITTGYGNEGDSPQCWFTADTQNVAKAFAAQTANHFNAEYSIVALSGLGVVRNLRSSEASSPETAIDFLDRTIAMNPVDSWDPQHINPDAVIVNLGTNDFSSLPFPEVEIFVEAYVDLLQRIRLRYPQVPIFALAGPLMLGPAPYAIRTSAERMRLDGDDNVHFVLIEDTLDESEGDFGCDWHPNVQGHKKIAKQLVLAMADVLGW